MENIIKQWSFDITVVYPSLQDTQHNNNNKQMIVYADDVTKNFCKTLVSAVGAILFSIYYTKVRYSQVVRGWISLFVVMVVAIECPFRFFSPPPHSLQYVQLSWSKSYKVHEHCDHAKPLICHSPSPGQQFACITDIRTRTWCTQQQRASCAVCRGHLHQPCCSYHGKSTVDTLPVAKTLTAG